MNAPASLGPVPGPPAWKSATLFVRFTRELPWSLVQHAARFGDLHRFRLGTDEEIFALHPRHVEQVLHDGEPHLLKDPVTHMLDSLLGQGLLTSEGETWKTRRRLVAPKLSRKHVASYADEMVLATEEAVAAWQHGERFELHQAMMALTLDIVARTLFGERVGGDTKRVGAALDRAMDDFYLLIHTWRRLVPRSVRLPARERFDRVAVDIDEVIRRIIADKRAGDLQGNDLLTLLIRAAEEDDAPLDETALRDEAVTMLAAGHETTANALTYAWALLSHAPDALQRMRDEVAAVLGDRPFVADDMSALPYTRAVAMESLRLYPPAWVFGRETTAELRLDGYSVPPGSIVLMFPSYMHRDPRWYDAPHAFKPERWLGDLEQRLPRYAFCPFGGGRRVCIGNHFAMLELVAVLATMSRRVRLHWEGTFPLPVKTAVTMRPAVPLEVAVERVDAS